jgi:hypothetical protein
LAVGMPEQVVQLIDDLHDELGLVSQHADGTRVCRATSVGGDCSGDPTICGSGFKCCGQSCARVSGC